MSQNWRIVNSFKYGLDSPSQVPNKLTRLRDMLSEDTCEIGYGDPRNFSCNLAPRNNNKNEDPNIDGQTPFTGFDYGVDNTDKCRKWEVRQ